MSYTGRKNGNGNQSRWGYNNRTLKLPQPKNPANQDGLNRLFEKYEKSRGNENYERTLSRAIKSLSASKEAITTFEEALALKNVGNHCARIIVPPNDEGGQNLSVAKPKSNKSKDRVTKKKGSTTSEPSNSNNASSTAKEQAYQAAKEEAMKKWNHPIICNSRADHAYGLKWKVLLLVDGREPKSQHILSKCGMSGIPAEERHLPIGDMMWIAQGLQKHQVGGKTTTSIEAELLLGTIIERKSTEDLVSSFLGTRYMEQRLRLQHSGQPQILFLIEGDINKEDRSGFGSDRVKMALSETRAQLGFQIVFTEHMTDTILQLKRCHRRILQRAFPDAFGIHDDALPTYNPELGGPQPSTGRRRQRRPTSLVEMVFDTPPTPAFMEHRFQTYQELKCKIERDREAGTKTVGAIHGKMLRQICGLKQVQAIREQYPTPASLLNAYGMVDDNPKSQAELVKDCSLDANGRKVGPKVSQEIYDNYCCLQGDGESASNQIENAINGATLKKRLSPSQDSTDNLMCSSKCQKLEEDLEPRTKSNMRIPLATLKAPPPKAAASASSTATKPKTTTAQTTAVRSATLAKQVGNSSSRHFVDLLSSDHDSDTDNGIGVPETFRQSKQGKENNKEKPCRDGLKENPVTKIKSMLLLEESSDDEACPISGRHQKGMLNQAVCTSQLSLDSSDEEGQSKIHCQKSTKSVKSLVCGESADDAIEID